MWFYLWISVRERCIIKKKKWNMFHFLFLFLFCTFSLFFNGKYNVWYLWSWHRWPLSWGQSFHGLPPPNLLDWAKFPFWAWRWAQPAGRKAEQEEMPAGKASTGRATSSTLLPPLYTAEPENAWFHWVLIYQLTNTPGSWNVNCFTQSKSFR